MIKMRTIDKQNIITAIQKNFDMPLCFELSREKLRDQATIETLINRITSNTMRDGDQFALLEIIKEWLEFTDQPAPAEERSEMPISTFENKES